jgi:hypothetical protein
MPEQNEHLARHPLLPIDVSFTYPVGHPTAPADVQAIIDSLTFTPVAI